MQEGGVALLPELLVLLALHAPHPLHHLLAQLHGGGQRFGVPAQDVAEVNVEEFPCRRRECSSELFQELGFKHRVKEDVCLTRLRQEQIVQMSVPDSQDVGDDAVAGWKDTEGGVTSVNVFVKCGTQTHREPRLLHTHHTLTTALHVGVHHLGADAVRPLLTRCMFPEEALIERTDYFVRLLHKADYYEIVCEGCVSADLDVAFSRQDFSHRDRLDKLHETWNQSKCSLLHYSARN